MGAAPTPWVGRRPEVLLWGFSALQGSVLFVGSTVLLGVGAPGVRF